MKKYAAQIAMLAVLVAPAFASAETIGPITFEQPTYSLGNINGQDGWMKTGPYDVAVSTSTVSGFGAQSLRISDAVTSGSFSDQTFAKPLANAAGEASSTAGGFSVGTLQSHFETQFNLASVLPTLQTGMHVTVSPDRGDGSRMSYLRFEDQADGTHIFFDDVQGTSTPANFVETEIATTTRAAHTIKLSIDFVNGPSNDVVKVWVDGVLVHTGTSWENYYRYDTEASAEQSPRIVKTVLFRESGTAHPANVGNGFLIDNLTLTSSTPSTPVNTAPTVTLNGSSTINIFVGQNFVDPGATGLDLEDGTITPVVTGSVNNMVAGQYMLTYTVTDSGGLMASTTRTVNVNPALPTGPTDKDQCKDGGWKTFTNPTFKNQGQCVSSVVSHRDK